MFYFVLLDEEATTKEAKDKHNTRMKTRDKKAISYVSQWEIWRGLSLPGIIDIVMCLETRCPSH